MVGDRHSRRERTAERHAGQVRPHVTGAQPFVEPAQGGAPAKKRLAVRDWVTATAVACAAFWPWIIGAGAALGIGLLAAGKRRAGIGWLATAISAYLVRRESLRRLCAGARSGQGPTPNERTDRVRLVSANVWNGSINLPAIATELAELDADMVVLQEVTPRHLRRLDESATLGRYPEKVVMPDHEHNGLGVWSRFELSEVEWLEMAGERQLRAWVTLPGGGRLRLYVVHAPSPIVSKIDRWCSWFGELARAVSVDLCGHPHPLLVAGDFNATVDHMPFRRLLRAGLGDAALLAGRGWQMTWPTHRRALPPLFGLDHILVRSNVRVANYRLGRGVGSDHRPVVVDLIVTG